MNPDDVTPPTCTVCHSGLYDTELARQACTPCERRTDENLAALPGPDGLYARLSASLHPGSCSGGPAVSGSRSAPLPLRLAPLSLAARGGVVTILQTWLIDWHEQLDYRHPRWDGDLQQQCDQVVKRLRILLPWAAEAHGAFSEFAYELSSLRRQCEAASGGEKSPRRVGVTLDTAGVKCPACSTQYGHSEALRLPLAERRAAA